MSLFAHRGVITIFIGAAFALVACEAEMATPTPRPTWTPRANLPLNALTPVPGETAGALPPSAVVASGAPNFNTTPLPLLQTTPQPLIQTGPQAIPATVEADGTPRAAAPNPLVSGSAAFLPKFGPFPPVPVPNRPANLNPLTGLTADPAMLQRRPLVARIGNEQMVRTNNWHAGLSQADIVFEELIDIINNSYSNTRFSAVFLSQDPQLIGPIRSGRIINFQMVPMLNGALVFSGASDNTRWLFAQSSMINLDEGLAHKPAYCYDKTRGYQGRLLTSGPRIREWLRQKGWEAPSPLYGFSFSDRAPGGQAVTSISLSKAPWPPSAQATWNYNSASGKYLRVSVGKPHMDTWHSITAKWSYDADCVTTGPDTSTQISASNVVVLYARHERTNIIEDQNNAVSVYVQLTGQGDAQFFRDGVMTQGKWQRKSEQEFWQFTDSSGNSVALKPGVTWFEIVPIGYQLDLK